MSGGGIVNIYHEHHFLGCIFLDGLVEQRPAVASVSEFLTDKQVKGLVFLTVDGHVDIADNLFALQRQKNLKLFFCLDGLFRCPIPSAVIVVNPAVAFPVVTE